MCKLIVAVMLLCAGGQLAKASVITTASPVPIDGSGSFFVSLILPNALFVNVSGTNGVDSVSLKYGTVDDQGLSATFCVCVNISRNTSASATINGITSPIVDFSIGNGGGHINLYAPSSHDLIASADLIGWVQVWSVTEGPRPGDITRQFLITSTEPIPEPATVGLVGLVLAGLFLRRRSLT